MPPNNKYKMDALLRGLYAAQYAKRDETPCQIEEGLFLGSVGAAFNRDELKSLNVTHILTVAKSLKPAYPEDFVYRKVEVLDNPYTDLSRYFDACIEFIDKARREGGGVLVHCVAGRSRSVTVVAAYLMQKNRMSLFQVLDLIKSKRPQICPNPGFIRQLETLQRRLQAEDGAETSEK
ncbi:dual specificity protein phosphatase 1-like [Wolffia australiana]